MIPTYTESCAVICEVAEERAFEDPIISDSKLQRESQLPMAGLGENSSMDHEYVEVKIDSTKENTYDNSEVYAENIYEYVLDVHSARSNSVMVIFNI